MEPKQFHRILSFGSINLKGGSGARKDLRLADLRSIWEFPVLAQYQWRIGRAKPFVEMGPSFRLLQGVYGAAPYGIAVGAGVEERVGRLKISPD